jgi:hypothetical protein
LQELLELEKTKPFKYYQAVVQFWNSCFDDGSKGDFRWITKRRGKSFITERHARLIFLTQLLVFL